MSASTDAGTAQAGPGDPGPGESVSDAAHGATEERWLALAERLALTGAADEYRDLAADYDGPGRHYHTLRHVGACLDALESVRHSVDDATHDRIALALWFHDVVYEPGSATNEADSAARGVRYVTGAGRPDLADDLHRLVMVTVHPSIPHRADEAWLVDIDLGILGQPWPVYERFEQAIRAEYRHVPDAVFLPRRRALLGAFLDTPRLYHTDHFHDRLDAPARDNLRRAIALLT